MIITNDKDHLYHEPSRGYIYPFFFEMLSSTIVLHLVALQCLLVTYFNNHSPIR